MDCWRQRAKETGGQAVQGWGQNSQEKQEWPWLLSYMCF